MTKTKIKPITDRVWVKPTEKNSLTTGVCKFYKRFWKFYDKGNCPICRARGYDG